MMTPKLQHELKKKRPFESPEEEALLSVVRTSDQVQIRFARLLREYGLTPLRSTTSCASCVAKASRCPSWRSPAAPLPLCRGLPA